MPIRKMLYKFTTTRHVVFCIHIVQKHAMLKSYSHCDCSLTDFGSADVTNLVTDRV
jgi:hypothetical protein